MTFESQKQRYPQNKEKMFYLPIPYYKQIRTQKKFPVSDQEVRLCYCGDYGSRVRNLKPLYDAAKESGMYLTVCGMSDLTLKSTGRIKVLPRQAASKVREIEKEADVLIHLSNLSGTQIPGKIYQYISTDKTILFILDGDKMALKNTFSEYGRFIFVENNKDDIKEVLKKICELRENVSNEPVIDFSAKNVAQKLVEIRRIQK